MIDLQNHIYKPLTDQRVKVMVQQIRDSHTFTKEFEVVIKGLHQDEGVCGSFDGNHIILDSDAIPFLTVTLVFNLFKFDSFLSLLVTCC